MFVRLTFVKFSPEAIQQAKKTFHQDIVPAIKKQKGSLGVRLLEPVSPADDFISITEWKTKADADAYESSGLYKKLVARLEDHFVKPPVLKTYNVEEIAVPAH